MATRALTVNRTVTALFLIALSSTIAASANAAGSAETNALKLFDEGRKSFEKKQFDVALTSFEASIQLVSSPNTRLYIGRCLRELGKTASAHTALLRAAAEAHDASGNGEARYRATEESAKTEAEALLPAIAHLVVGVPPSVKDPHVMLDGVEVPAASFAQSLDVDPGQHVVKASATRSQPFESNVEAQPGNTTRVDVVLTGQPTAVVHLDLADRPAGYSVSLDGRPVEASTMSTPIELEPGAHTIVITAPGRADFTWTNTLNDGDDISVMATLTALSVDDSRGKRPFPKWPFFAVGGASIVALGAATALAANAKSISDTEKAKPVADRASNERDHVTSLSHEANALFIIGGGLLIGTGVVGWFTWRSPSNKREIAKIAPWIGTNAGGVVTGGTF